MPQSSTTRKRRLAIDAKIQRTHKSIFQTNDGFSRCFGDGDWFRRAGTMSPHGDSINFLRNRAQQKVSGTVAPEISPDAEYARCRASKCQSCVFSQFLCHQGAHFSGHAGVSTPGPVAATSNVRMLILRSSTAAAPVILPALAWTPVTDCSFAAHRDDKRKYQRVSGSALFSITRIGNRRTAEIKRIGGYLPPLYRAWLGRFFGRNRVA